MQRKSVGTKSKGRAQKGTELKSYGLALIWTHSKGIAWIRSVVVSNGTESDRSAWMCNRTDVNSRGKEWISTGISER